VIEPLDPENLGRVLAALTPRECDHRERRGHHTGSARGAVLALPAQSHPPCSAARGGAIGQGLPAALGAALACPDRRAIAFQADDGSGIYTVQALWSMARESGGRDRGGAFRASAVVSYGQGTSPRVSGGHSVPASSG
jgi:acetolactate synthase-1/2/3 large subunit